MEGVISWVKQIFIVSILSNIILHMMPSEKYEQYAKFICGIVIALTCISPLISILNGDTIFTDAYQSIVNSQNIQDMKSELKYAETDQRDELIKTYEQKVASQIDEKTLEYGLYPSDTQVVIDSDPESENYGTIQQLNLVVSLTKEKEKGVTIEDVNIGKITIGDTDNAKNTKSGKKTENNSVVELKDYLSSFYNLNLSNINININGD